MISSSKNPRIKELRKLRTGRGDHVILDGPHLVGEACTQGIKLREIFVTERFLESTEGRELIPRLGTDVQTVAAPVLRALTDADSPQGIIGVAHLPRSADAELPLHEQATAVYLERVQDPGNLGAIARAAEAAGIDALLLSPGCAHPNHPRALRASAGSLLRLPLAWQVEFDAVPGLPWNGAEPSTVALAAHGGEDLYSTELKPPLLLVIGGEGPGLSSATEHAVDRVVTIPVQPPVESLNAAVAAALVFFELRRR